MEALPFPGGSRKKRFLQLSPHPLPLGPGWYILIYLLIYLCFTNLNFKKYSFFFYSSWAANYAHFTDAIFNGHLFYFVHHNYKNVLNSSIEWFITMQLHGLLQCIPAAKFYRLWKDLDVWKKTPAYKRDYIKSFSPFFNTQSLDDCMDRPYTSFGSQHKCQFFREHFPGPLHS